MHLKYIYNRKKKLNSDGTAPISLYISHTGAKKYVHTNMYVKPEEWDNKHGEVSRHHSNHIHLNAVLKRKKADLEEWFYEQQIKKRPVDISQISWSHGSSDLTFNEFAYHHLEKEKETLAPKTISNLKLAIEKFSQFAPGIPLKAITYETIEDYEFSLKREKYHPNTIYRFLKHVRRFMYRAEEKMLIDEKDNPFHKKRLHEVKTEPKYLDPEWIDKIKELEFSEIEQNQLLIRDMFLFSVYTGLRYSDIITLDKKDIQISEQGYYIHRQMQKTLGRKDVGTYIPLWNIFNGAAQKIIDTYVDDDRDTVFPYVTNQHMNRMLKRIWGKLGIPNTYTFHSARHTCATYLLYKGVNIKIVQKILGHEDLKTTENYARVLRKTIDNELDRIEW